MTQIQGPGLYLEKMGIILPSLRVSRRLSLPPLPPPPLFPRCSSTLGQPCAFENFQPDACRVAIRTQAAGWRHGPPRPRTADSDARPPERAARQPALPHQPVPGSYLACCAARRRRADMSRAGARADLRLYEGRCPSPDRIPGQARQSPTRLQRGRRRRRRRRRRRGGRRVRRASIRHWPGAMRAGSDGGWPESGRIRSPL